MKSIIPCLWFDSNAEEAVNFYTSVFQNTTKGDKLYYDELSAEVSGQPEGSLLTFEFTLCGQKFVAMNGGPVFRFSPAVSFYVECNGRDELTTLWNALSASGKVLMELDKYPYSELYGWTEDRFGLSWQLILSENKQNIRPVIMLSGNNYGKAEKAMNFYTSFFPSGEIKTIARYGPEQPAETGKVAFAIFSLAGHEFVMMESGYDHKFSITQAVSFMIECEGQEEVNMYWDRLTGGGEEQPCGWLLDRYSLAWQVVPLQLNSLLASNDRQKARNAMKAMLEMKKLDINVLMDAFNRI